MKKRASLAPASTEYIADFLDMVMPSVIKFDHDRYICGNTYRSTWAVREYPTSTTQHALLRHLGEKDGVTLKIYTRPVTPGEERKIYSGAEKSNKLMGHNATDIQQSVMARQNIEDVENVIATTLKNREPLLHCAVFIELIAQDSRTLEELQSAVLSELARAKINVDRLTLRQREGFISVQPAGYNAFSEQFERVLPASSVANLYPFCYSGKTDPCGHFLGRDKYGSNIITDFDARAEDKTNGNIIILGNSGQGKSYLLKNILTIFRETGKRSVSLDAEGEYIDLTNRLGGSYIDLMSGTCCINVLEPKTWTDESDSGAKLSGHISFLKDFFRSYKDFTDPQIDTIEIMLQKLYKRFSIGDHTDFSTLFPKDYPTLADLYSLTEKEYHDHDESKRQLYTTDTLQQILLGIHSICVGADSKFFSGHTKIEDAQFITFGLKGILEAGTHLRNAMMFNLLSFMSNALLTQGNAVACIDEFYLFLSNLTAVEYIRNFMKRVRKKNSNVILASQNIEDYFLPGIAEYTKPLFSIPTHQFIFNPGSVDKKAYIDNLQLEESEYELIRLPQRGSCLYKCGNERYNLQVKAPPHRAVLFGDGGGN